MADICTLSKSIWGILMPQSIRHLDRTSALAKTLFVSFLLAMLYLDCYLDLPVATSYPRIVLLTPPL